MYFVRVNAYAFAGLQRHRLPGEVKSRSLRAGGGDVDVIAGNVHGRFAVVGDDDVFVGFGFGHDAVEAYVGYDYAGAGGHVCGFGFGGWSRCRCRGGS